MKKMLTVRIPEELHYELSQRADGGDSLTAVVTRLLEVAIKADYDNAATSHEQAYRLEREIAEQGYRTEQKLDLILEALVAASRPKGFKKR